MAPATRAAKKQILSSSITAPIHTIPKAVLMVCMEYVGSGNFAFVGAVSREFHKYYAKLYSDCKTSPRGFASDSLECAKMCIENDIENDIENENEDFNRKLFRWAARKGCSDIVKYCINHCSIPRDIFYHSSLEDDHYGISRHWKVLKLVKKHSFDVDWCHCCYGAAKAKNKELVIRIIDNIDYYDYFESGIYAIAASENDLNTLKWLWEQGFEWDERVCYHAARNLNIGMLQWARSNGCPWNENTYYAAFYGRNKDLEKANEIFAYLENNSLQMPRRLRINFS